jgi:hypothetical protein
MFELARGPDRLVDSIHPRVPGDAAIKITDGTKKALSARWCGGQYAENVRVSSAMSFLLRNPDTSEGKRALSET